MGTGDETIASSGNDIIFGIEEIRGIVDGPISAEAVSLKTEEIVKEAETLSKIHKNIVVKVPVIREGIKAVKVLTDRGIRTNMILNFNATQALMAVKVGAGYISPFVGRLDNYDGMEPVRQIKTIYGHYGFTTEILVAAQSSFASERLRASSRSARSSRPEAAISTPGPGARSED
jgi:transaldolase